MAPVAPALLAGQFLFDPLGQVDLEQGLVGNILPVCQ